jgi:ABC-type multidrug transport system fused ATPase/permease subunit
MRDWHDRALASGSRQEFFFGILESPLLILVILPAFAIPILGFDASWQASLISLALYGLTAAAISSYSRSRQEHRMERIEDAVQRRLQEFDPANSGLSLRSFHARLDDEVRRSVRYGIDLSVVVLRLGNESVSLSHLQETTAAVVAFAAHALRMNDMAAYLGAYDYAFALPHTDRASAEVVMSRLATTFAPYSPVMGLSVLEEDHALSGEEMLGRAVNDLNRHHRLPRKAA